MRPAHCGGSGVKESEPVGDASRRPSHGDVICQGSKAKLYIGRVFGSPKLPLCPLLGSVFESMTHSWLSLLP